MAGVLVMVKSATSLTVSGLRDWLIQRVSAVLIGVYVLFLLGYIMFCPSFDFPSWQALFTHTAMRVATIMVLVATLLHVYIGMWTISTDYLKNTAVRIAFQSIVRLSLVACVIWGIIIVWGV